MSMDALTNASLESLLQSALDRVRAELTQLMQQEQSTRLPEPELIAAVQEARELLGMVAAWIDEVLSPARAAQTLDADEAGELMSDLGQLMEEDQSAFSGVVEEEVVATEVDMGDDEAARLLAEMEAPTAASVEPVSDAPAELDDDEAARLLAEMESPVSTTVSASSTDLDDDEAARLLAEMEAPADQIEMPAVKKAVVIETSADDEAAALLASLGGEDDEEEHVEVAMPADATTAGDHDDGPDFPTGDDHTQTSTGDIGEIGEWEANDFQADPDMMNDFLSNCDELMQSLDGAILRLEQSPEDKEVIEEIFRAAHTLKGAAGMFGFKALERVMHRMENLFDLCRKGKLTPNADTVDVLFQGMDVIRTLLDAVRNGAPCGAPTAPIVQSLEAVAKGKSPAKPASKAVAKNSGMTVEAKQVNGAVAQSGSDGSSSGSGGAGASAKQVEQSTIRVDLHRLDALVNLIGELVIDRTRFNHIEEVMRVRSPQSELVGDMAETVQLFGRHMNEVQDIIMKVRMVPIGNAFNKFPRIVRELARSLGKNIDLFISGENAELDKTLVEQLGDPLIHLIRNSCDHGIETPDVRTAAGKAANGAIFLSARQEGNHIIVSIQDDGKGLDREAIRQKGIERGLISADEQLSDRDIFNLIFEAGFSTAKLVTEVSGRGVGMDVVKRQISKLKGMIELSSQPGQGTTVSIQLPLTLAIVQSLLVSSHGETYAIPLSSVIESIRIHPKSVQRVGDVEVIKLRDHVLPLIHLGDMLDLKRKQETMAHLMHVNVDGEDATEKLTARQTRRRQERLYVVVVGSAEHRYGIVVDQLLNQQEMVIKSMGPLMKDIPCVAGGAVLGHGEVVLVLDVGELVDAFHHRSRASKAA